MSNNPDSFENRWGERLNKTVMVGLQLVKQFRGDLKLGDSIWTDEEIDAYLNLSAADILQAAQEIVENSEHHS